MPDYQIAEALVANNILSNFRLHPEVIHGNDEMQAFQNSWQKIRWAFKYNSLDWYSLSNLYVRGSQHVFAAIEVSKVNNYQSLLQKKFNTYLSLGSGNQVQTPPAPSQTQQVSSQLMKFPVYETKGNTVIGYVESQSHPMLPGILQRNQIPKWSSNDFLKRSSIFLTPKHMYFSFRAVHLGSDMYEFDICKIFIMLSPNDVRHTLASSLPDYIIDRNPVDQNTFLINKTKKSSSNNMTDVDPITKALMSSSLKQHGLDYCPKCGNRKLSFVRMSLVCDNCKTLVGGT